MPYRDVQHSYLKAMSDKFVEKPDSTKTKFYVYGSKDPRYATGGLAQKGATRKREFIDDAAKIVAARTVGTPAYNPDVGMPQGQRFLMSYMMNHTDMMVYHDDLHWVNNAAMQQSWMT